MTPRSRLKRLSILPTGLVWKKDSGDRMTLVWMVSMKIGGGGWWECMCGRLCGS